MSLKAQVSHDVDAVWDMDETSLIELLGVSQMGTEAVADSLESYALLSSVAAETDGIIAKSNLTHSLKAKGQAFFTKLWNSIKEIICHIYTENLPVEGDKDLAKYLVGVIVAAGKLTNALAALIITIAVKKGLDTLCHA